MPIKVNLGRHHWSSSLGMLKVGKMDLTTVDIWQVLVDRLIDDGEVALVVIIHFLFLP